LLSHLTKKVECERSYAIANMKSK